MTGWWEVRNWDWARAVPYSPGEITSPPSRYYKNKKETHSYDEKMMKMMDENNGKLEIKLVFSVWRCGHLAVNIALELAWNKEENRNWAAVSLKSGFLPRPWDTGAVVLYVPHGKICISKGGSVYLRLRIPKFGASRQTIPTSPWASAGLSVNHLKLGSVQSQPHLG